MDQEETQKLLTCKQCIHSNCAGNFANKCSESDLECNIQKENVISMIENEKECPKGYWRSIFVSSGGGCGCG